MAEKTKDHHEFIPEAAFEHAKAARAEMRKSFAAILPPEFIAHRKKARLEMLRAAREIINHALERLESDTVGNE
jgi:23S rRNA G2069 N7-methylase RlmK/C1962 C5-methylase RlmI